jgi:diacylglycerol kinase family enzyme
MPKAYVFYNPLAGNGRSEDIASSLKKMITDEMDLCDITDTEIYKEKLSSLCEGDYVILCGGDGTLNRFVNSIDGMNIENDILYYPVGSGNDFARDLGKVRGDKPFSVKQYIEELPTVCVNGNKYRFINGVGYGIDGYCCEIGDKLRAESDKPINYTAIAIKGLLFHYKPKNARVTVDGVVHTYKNVWLAPTMFGRYYGGGMLPTPGQTRTESKDKLATLVLHTPFPLRVLMIFPSIFKGEHVKFKKNVEILSGKEITVEYDRPAPIQIDGETILGVTSYTARAYAKEPEYVNN